MYTELRRDVLAGSVLWKRLCLSRTTPFDDDDDDDDDDDNDDDDDDIDDYDHDYMCLT